MSAPICRQHKKLSPFFLVLCVFVSRCSASYEDWYFDSFYDDYYWDYFDFLYDEDCIVDGNGDYVLNGTQPCDVKVSGGYEADVLTSGLSGLYVYNGCQNGKAMYKRVKSEFGGLPDGDRYLIFSSYWGDWDFSDSEVLTDDATLGYGGEGDSESFPQDVPRNDWYLLTELCTTCNGTEQDFIYAPSIVVECNANCTDGEQNGFELGVDCGGECKQCDYMDSTYIGQEDALRQLRNKVQAETSTRLSPFEKAMIVFVCFLGTGIVCGGPTMYFIKKYFKDQRSNHRVTGLHK